MVKISAPGKGLPAPADHTGRPGNFLGLFFCLAKLWVLQCCLWFWFGWSKEVLENTRKRLKLWMLTRQYKGVGRGPHLWLKDADKVNIRKSNILVLEQLLARPDHKIGNQYLHTAFGLLLLKLWSGLEAITIYREYENYFVAHIKHHESLNAKIFHSCPYVLFWYLQFTILNKTNSFLFTSCNKNQG